MNTQLFEKTKNLLIIILIILGFALFLFGGISSILHGSKTTLTCKVNLEKCDLVEKNLFNTNKIEFSLPTLKGAYLKPYGDIIVRADNEYQFSSSVYSSSMPYGQDILSQEKVNKINQFVQNPHHDFTISTSNRLFKYTVGILLLLVVGFACVFIFTALFTKNQKVFLKIILTMLSIIIFVSGFLFFIAINHSIELNCTLRKCQLLASRVQETVEIALDVEDLQQAEIKSTNYEDRTLYQVILNTSQGNFSLLGNANAVSAMSLVNEVNQFIDYPIRNRVNFHTDNRLLSIFLAGLCFIFGLIPLYFQTLK